METMNIALLRGRYFDDRDTEKSPRVAIIDERLAHEFWPDLDPIGRRMFPPSGPNDLTEIDEHTIWITVVGVVRTVRLEDLTGAGNSGGTYYFPYAQSPRQSYMFAVNGRGDQAGLTYAARAAMAGVDPELALFDIKSMAERKDHSLSSRKASMSIALGFAELALFLSTIGIYSVLSYLLGQRRREIGIRLAVGSSPSGIFRLFLREGLVLIGAGLVVGVAGAAALRKAVENQIYEVQPFDPLVIGAVTVVLGGLALAACLRPAQQAMHVDPVVVLNEQ
jgi:ABC-type antimicrobial peptide transport system permease subunit